MKHKITGIVMILGSMLLGLSVALPVIATSNTNIIGGADFATFLFHFGRTSWMAFVGIASIVVCLLVRHKK